MVYRDISDGKLKIKYGDLWKIIATLFVIGGSFIIYKTSIDSALGKLDYTKADKTELNRIEQTVTRMDEKMNFIYEYLKEQKERRK